MNECVFCEIVQGSAPASIVYDDRRVMAFLTIGPVNPGHALVIPKRHVSGLAGLDEETGMHLFRVAMRIAAAIRRSPIKCEGINFFLADGQAAFQEVDHLHLHVFPPFKGDGFRLDADWSVKPSREELDRAAAEINRAYRDLWGGAHHP